MQTEAKGKQVGYLQRAWRARRGKQKTRKLWLATLLSLVAPRVAQPQVTAPAAECGLKSLQVCVLHVAQDEAGIVTGPFHLKSPNYFWLLPFGAATGFALEKDNDAMRAVGIHPNREKDFRRVSDYGGLYGPSAAVAVGYVTGSLTHNDHLRQTAVLSGEAMADSIILNKGLQYAIDRQTPMQGDGTGRFWPHGVKTWPDGQSMPSDHSILAWSFAHVVATQYNGLATKLIVYSLATTVSASRVMAREHFPSDVFVGSALGYFIGGYVTQRRSPQSEWNHFAVAPIRTPNGNGLQLSYNFAH